MESDNVKDQILSDAIQTAIEAEKKIVILKRIICVLVGMILILCLEII